MFFEQTERTFEGLSRLRVVGIFRQIVESIGNDQQLMPVQVDARAVIVA